MTQDELIKLPDAYECVMWSSRKRDAIYRKAPMGRGTVPTLKNRRRAILCSASGKPEREDLVTDQVGNETPEVSQ